MSNEELEQAIARADAEYDMLKDTCHDQYDKIKELEEKLEKIKNLAEENKFNNWVRPSHLQGSDLVFSNVLAEEIIKIIKGVENE